LKAAGLLGSAAFFIAFLGSSHRPPFVASAAERFALPVA
jgi:hypothetical protein